MWTATIGDDLTIVEHQTLHRAQIFLLSAFEVTCADDGVVSKAADNPGHEATLLALPSSPTVAVPKSRQHLEWTYHVQMDASDVSLGGPTARVQERIRKDGHAEVPFRLNLQA